jgi:ribonuclease PH
VLLGGNAQQHYDTMLSVCLILLVFLFTVLSTNCPNLYYSSPSDEILCAVHPHKPINMKGSVLSNCYVPITYRDESTSTSTSPVINNHPYRCRTQQEASFTNNNENDDDDDEKNKNLQYATRTRETLRPLVLETSWILSSSSLTSSSLLTASTYSPVIGSSLVEWGLTKVIAQLSLITDGSCLVETGTLVVRVDATLPARLISGRNGSHNVSAPISSSTTNTLSLELESQIHRAILPSLNLKFYPKTILQLDLTLIQNDGSILSACILASTLALADAQIELYDLVTCCQSVVVRNDQNIDDSIQDVWVDPDSNEEQYSLSNVSLAIMGQTQEVTFWRQQQQQMKVLRNDTPGESSVQETKLIHMNHTLNDEAIRLCRDGCRTLYKFVKEHLREKEEQWG